MKNFLKSTVVFACVAMLFCACSTDDTEVSGNLQPSTIESIYPGDGRVLLTWAVPEGNITASTITWSSSNGTTGSTNVAVTPGKTKEYQLVNLTAGTYKVTVQNINASGSSSIVSEDVDVYTVETYSSCMPVIQSMIFSSSTDAVVTWLPYSDCTYVQITYVDVNTLETVVTDKLSVDETMPLSGVTSGGRFTIKAFFQPEIGLDEVYVTSTSVFDTAPPEPTNVTVVPGNKRARVNWTMSSTALRYAGSTKIEYSGASEGTFVYTDLVYGDNECWVEGLSSGAYTFKVYNAKVDTETPSIIAELSATVYEEAYYGVSYLTVGDLSYYKEATRPGGSTVGTLDDYPFIGVEISWTKAHEDCVGVIVSYVPYGSTESVESEYFSCDVPTILADAQRGEQFTFTSHFCPTGGVDIVELAAQKGVDYYFTETTPAVPVSVLAQAGVTYTTAMDPVTESMVTTANSYVTLSWAISDETSVSYTTIYYQPEDFDELNDQVLSATVSYPATTTTINNLEPGRVYEFKVATNRISGTESATTIDTTAKAYDNDTFNDVLPVPNAYYIAGSADVDGDDKVYISWDSTTLDEDLLSVTIEYGGETTTYTKANGMISTANYTVDVATEGYSTYSWSATFLPDGALDKVVIVGGEDLAIGALSIDNDIEYDSTNGLYKINTGWGLAAFADLVNGTNYASTRAATASYTLSTSLASGHTLGTTQDASLNATVMYPLELSEFCNDTDGNWMPIGLYSNSTEAVSHTIAYTGTFDGSNCTISNVYLSTSDQYMGSRVGLFGLVTNATIKNIIMHNPYIAGYNNIGGIVGYATTSTITSCSTTIDASLHVDVDSSNCTTVDNYRVRSLTRGEGVAGIVGKADGCVISNCYNNVNAGATTGGQGRGSGGIVGVTALSGTTITTVTDCYNTGAIRGNSYNTGGLVGTNASTCEVTSCYNTGFVSGGSYCVGGIVGINAGAISGCYNTGNVYNTNTGLGGVAGTSSGTITACYSTGNLQTTSTSGTIGGVAGENTGSIVACYATGSVVGATGSYVGGVCGSSNATTSLSGCYYSFSIKSDDLLYDDGDEATTNDSDSGLAADGIGSISATAGTASSENAAYVSMTELTNTGVPAMNELLTDWVYTASFSFTTEGPTVSAVVATE